MMVRWAALVGVVACVSVASACYTRRELGCYTDCWDPSQETLLTKLENQKIERTLPFGVDGCCSGAPYDPKGICAGPCGQTLCAQSANPPAEQCPTVALPSCPLKCTLGTVSLDSCATMCLQLGFKLSGVEYANQCFCGHRIAAWARHDGDSSACHANCQGCPGKMGPGHHDDCEKCRCPGDSLQWCGGGCAMVVSEMECPWGSSFLLGCAVVGSLYFCGGIIWGSRWRGHRIGLRAHPHWQRWLGLRSLCVDGMQFSRLLLGSGAPRWAGHRRRARADADGTDQALIGMAAARGTGKKAGQKKSKKNKKGDQDRVGRARDDGHSPAPHPVSSVVSTDAGGGGRWVHIAE
jgi:hypothetical protein